MSTFNYSRPVQKSGLIPDDFYYRKLEASDVYENPYDTENYIRASLMDRTPDVPFFESDQPRTNQHSAERMELRHSCSRSDYTPYLAEGQFTHFEFTEKDPRGVQNVPNMRLGYEQHLARSSQIRLYNDADYSVPESMMTPEHIAEVKRNGFYGLKNRMKIFEESKDSFHNGGTTQIRRQGCMVGNVDKSGVIKDMADMCVRNRQDAVAQISNDPTTAFRHSTPDHRVRIAQYGRLVENRLSPDNLANVDLRKNMDSSKLDHVVAQRATGELLNRSIANLIVDLQGQRTHITEGMTGNIQFSKSTQGINRSHKLHPDDVNMVMKNEIQRSAGLSANTQFEGARVARYATRNTPDSGRNLTEQVQIAHDVADSMKQATRMIGKNKADSDLRDIVEETGKKQNIYREAQPMQLVTKAGQLQYDVDTSAKHGDSRTIFNYGIAIPQVDQHRYDNTAIDNKYRESHKGLVRSHNFDKAPLQPADFAQDQSGLSGSNDFGYVGRSTIRATDNIGSSYNADFGDIERDKVGSKDLMNY